MIVVRKEYNDTIYDAAQIEKAVHDIIHNNKSDYRADGSYPGSIKILCRNGYTWNTTAEIMWDRLPSGHLDIIAECRNSHAEMASAQQIQQENAEKHLEKISALLFKHIDAQMAKEKSKEHSSARLAILLIFLLIFVSAMIAAYYFGLIKI